MTDFEDEFVVLISDKKIIGLIQERGGPNYGFISWYDPDDYGQFEWELVELILKYRTCDFKLRESDLIYIIRKTLYEQTKSINLSEQLNSDQLKNIAHAVHDATSIKEKEFIAIIEINNLVKNDAHFFIDNVEIGSINTLISIDEKKIQELGFRQDTIFMKKTVKCPKLEFAFCTAVKAIEETIDILFSNIARLREIDGEFYCVSVGKNYCIIEGDKTYWCKHQMNLIEGRPFLLSEKLWKNVQDERFHSSIHPWVKFPPTQKMYELLKVSYRQFGHAYRNIQYPEDAIVFAVSAIDILLSPGHSDKYEMITNLVMAWSISNKWIPIPDELLHIIIIRNEILHEGKRVPWSIDEVQRMLFKLYLFLDRIIYDIESSGCIDKISYLTYLRNESPKYKTKENSKYLYDHACDLMKKTKTKSIRINLGPLLEMSKQILKRLPEDI